MNKNGPPLGPVGPAESRTLHFGRFHTPFGRREERGRRVSTYEESEEAGNSEESEESEESEDSEESEESDQDEHKDYEKGGRRASTRETKTGTSSIGH